MVAPPFPPLVARLSYSAKGVFRSILLRSIIIVKGRGGSAESRYRASGASGSTRCYISENRVNLELGVLLWKARPVSKEGVY